MTEGGKNFTEVTAPKSPESANSSVCGTRQLPCLEGLRHLPTTAHSAPSLSLSPAALRLEATPALALFYHGAAALSTESLAGFLLGFPFFGEKNGAFDAIVLDIPAMGR